MSQSGQSSCCLSPTSEDGGGWDEESQLKLFPNKRTWNDKEIYSQFLTVMVFGLESKIYHEGLKSAQIYLNKQIENQQKDPNFQCQCLHTLIPFLQLADVESRLGSVLPSYVGSVLVRKMLENLYKKDLNWIYWAQRLEIKILQRGQMFDRAHGVTLALYEQYRTQLAVENEAFKLENLSDTSNWDSCQDSKVPPWAWFRLLILGDLTGQLGRHKESLEWYMSARSKVFMDRNVEEKNREFFEGREKGGNFFKVENRIIKLYIKMRCHAEALELAQPLLKRQRDLCGDGHYSVLKTMHYISILFKYQGDYRQALKVAEQLNLKLHHSNVGFERLCEQLTPKMYGQVDMNLAELRLFLKEPNMTISRRSYAQVFQLIFKVLGETHPLVLETNLNIAIWFMNVKNVDKDIEFAKGLFERVVKIQINIYGDENHDEVKRTKKLIDQCQVKKNGQEKPVVKIQKSLSQSSSSHKSRRGSKNRDGCFCGIL